VFQKVTQQFVEIAKTIRSTSSTRATCVKVCSEM